MMVPGTEETWFGGFYTSYQNLPAFRREQGLSESFQMLSNAVAVQAWNPDAPEMVEAVA